MMMRKKQLSFEQWLGKDKAIETCYPKISKDMIQKRLLETPPTDWDDFSLGCMEEQCEFDLAYEKAKAEYERNEC